jgi:streptomycin 3"-adenylyltransferase
MPIPEVDQQQLARVVSLVRELLGADAVAAYLFGSSVLGGLRSESDLDVLAVSRRHTSHEEKQRLVGRLLAISGRSAPSGPWRRVELTIVVEGEVTPWRYPPTFDFQYGDWLRSEFEGGSVEPWPSKVMSDLAVLIQMVILADTPLLGPPPAQMFDPVPPGDLTRAMLAGIDPLRRELYSDTRNVLLTFARMWSTLATGDIRSKDAAAEWVLARLPQEHRRVLARARAIYLGQQPEGWDDLSDRLDAYVDYVVAEIRRLADDSVDGGELIP